MVLQVSPPSWADGIACPSLDGLDPIREAEMLLARAETCMRKGGPISTDVVNEVFALMQLAVNDRPTRYQTGSPTSEQKAFRRKLAEKTRDLSRELSAALQPRESESDEQGEGPRAAVVLAAQHYSEMAHVVMARSNTGALLIAHNGLAKLLSTRLPWLIGGVLDAPRLLSQLSRICCDGLDQLKMQLSSAEAGSPSGAEEVKQATKFGRLLASFCALMASLLRHLGPECPRSERRKAYELLAKTAAAIYPGVVAHQSAGKNASASTGASPASSLPAVVAGRLYPQTKEAFLSICGPLPCFVHRAGGGSISTEPEVSESTCRCFESSSKPGKNGGEGLPSRQRHDPWESVEALRPVRPPGESRSGGTAEISRSNVRNGAAEEENGSGGSNGDRLPVEDTVGAVLLLCEALRSKGKLSRTVSSRLLECCAWVLDHLAALFPGWVEAATAGSGLDGGVGGSTGSDAFEGDTMAAILCNEAGIALGLFVARRAMTGDFEGAQIQLLEGCACHPHPLCREIWLKALKAFLRRCDPTAQSSCILTFADAALDPRVCSRRSRRLARVLSACTAPGVLDSSASGRLRQFLVSRVQQGQKLHAVGGNGADSSSGQFASDRDSVGLAGGSNRGMKAAYALELLSGVSMRSFVDGEQELSVASIALARNAVVAGLRAAGEESRVPTGTVSGDRSSGIRGRADSLAVAVKFLAACLGSGTLASEEAAREAKRALGLALAGKGSAAGLAAKLSTRSLSAITGLSAKIDPTKLPQLCSFMIERAEEGKVDGQGLLALAEGLLSMGRQPFPSRPIDATIWEATLKTGFALLFDSSMWSVTTAAMQALEAMARHADPRTAALLPRLVPGSRLASFKARLSRKAVTLDGAHPIELGSLRERAWTEWRLLASAASALTEESKMHVSRVSMGSKGDPSGLHRQVVLRKGDNLNAMTGLLSYTVVDMEFQSDEAGGGVRITLRGE